MQVVWDAIGDREFETGIDRGVLYPHGQNGVAWNGLVSVEEKPTGGDAQPFYANGKRYLNLSNPEFFAGSIDAFTYPEEFEQCDGTSVVYDGFSIGQQNRLEFDLAYRTLKGNDIQGSALGYKIHLVYNGLANSSDKSYGTVADLTAPMTFSWDFTTTPIDFMNFAPVSHVILDSTRIDATTLKIIETKIYGSDDTEAQILTLDQLVSIYQTAPGIFKIEADPETGISELSSELTGDLMSDPTKPEGIYSLVTGSKLIKTSVAGIRILES